MTPERNVAMIQRRLTFLIAKRSGGEMERAEIAALEWALPLLRRTLPQSLSRASIAVSCPACKTPAGYACIHLGAPL